MNDDNSIEEISFDTVDGGKAKYDFEELSKKIISKSDRLEGRSFIKFCKTYSGNKKSD